MYNMSLISSLKISEPLLENSSLSLEYILQKSLLHIVLSFEKKSLKRIRKEGGGGEEMEKGGGIACFSFGVSSSF